MNGGVAHSVSRWTRIGSNDGERPGTSTSFDETEEAVGRPGGEAES